MSSSLVKRILGTSVRTTLLVSAALVIVTVPCASPPAQAQEWRPDFSLRPRPDGPGLSSLSASLPQTSYLLNGPATPAQKAAWLEDAIRWRTTRLAQIGYRDDIYRRPDLLWTRQIFTQQQLLVWDRTLFDPKTGRYTVDRALNSFERRFGVLDSVLLWFSYPMVGVDDRNQFDLLRDLPGGMAGLRDVVAAFHRRGVRVFFPVIIWDHGTHESPLPSTVEIIRMVHDLGADGVNLDTLDAIPDEASKTATRTSPAIALEPQFDTQNASIAASAISWNDWVLWDDSTSPFAPQLNLAKWLEPRHAALVTDRYARFKINSLQGAFFNGQGYAILENLWGFWDGFSDRDAQSVKRFTRIERAYSDALASMDRDPYTPTLQEGIFASRFADTSRTIWTIVNRNEYLVDGEQLSVPFISGMRYFNLWDGHELRPVIRDGKAILSFEIGPLGFSAIAAQSGADKALTQLLRAAQEDTATPLDHYSRATPFASQSMLASAPTHPASTPPAGMVAIPADDYDFQVSGIEVENGNDPGVDVQFPWEASPRRHHRHRLHVSSFFIDITPVTNQQFEKFINQTHYHPLDDHNFLRDWKGGTFPEGWANKPVTWVSLEDARAYAAWAGKRLPHVWEWQYAAQGTDGRLYPWGMTWNGNAVPPKERGRTLRAPTDVDAYPTGASPFGVLDMEGNVGQWTDEFSDEHTRAAIIRGGDFYRPEGAMWYFPKSDRLDEQEKYLLISAGRDRSAVVGFRCVTDATP